MKKKIYDLEDLQGAVVIDNCGMIRLADGSVAIWYFGINPEDKKTREYYDEDGQTIRLPVQQEC